MAEAHDVETLKRRGRRRLVGAVALVLAAVIILPMVFDPEPRRADAPVSVRIPGENEAPFAPQVAPKAPEKKIEVKKTEVKKTETKKTEASTEYVVPVGAFANPESVIAKLAAARLPYYTEAVKGNLTRVRAGPFASKEAAEKALQQLKGMGLAPGTVTTKAG
jgi:DedD protein